MKQEQLIFLISQPRSGSTLLQKILGANSNIYTRSEPWISLNFLYNLSNNNLNEIVYDKKLENIAINDFIKGLTDSRDTYLKEIRQMLLNLYGNYLEQSKKPYFLDKTPRYYFILDQLKEVFPNSKKILLIRNPLDVLNSLIPRKKTLYMLSDNKFDLIEGLNVIIEQLKQKDSNLYIIKYENLVNNTNHELENLCDYLNINFEKEMVLNLFKNEEKWIFGDQKIYNKHSIEKTSIEQWKNHLDNPQYWRLFYDYLLLIGKKNFEMLGYDYDKSLKSLFELNPYENLEEILDKTKKINIYLDKDRDSLIQLYSKNQELEQKQKVIEQKNNELKEKNQELSKKNDECLVLNDKLNEKNQELEQKQKVIEQKNNELKEKNQELEQKQKVINWNKQLLLNKELEKVAIDKYYIQKESLISNSFKDLIDINVSKNPLRKLKNYKKLIIDIRKFISMRNKLVELPTDDFYNARHKKFYISQFDKPILIYQVGKVGSSTIYESLKGKMKNVPIYQIHNIEMADEILKKENEKGFIEGLHHLIIGSELNQIIKENPQIHWKIIVGIREPIQRWLSDIFQNINERYKHFVKEDGDLKYDELIDFIKDTIETEPMQDWFLNELSKTFKIDLSEINFDKENGFFVYSIDNKEILFYQLESLKPKFNSMFQEFLPEYNISLKNANESTNKRYYEQYKKIQGLLTFDEDYLRKFYYEKSVGRFFYTEIQIENFINKWKKENK